MKKLLSILLVLCMVLAAVPMLLVPAVAAEEATADQGDKLTSLVANGENWPKWHRNQDVADYQPGAYVLDSDFGDGWHFVRKTSATYLKTVGHGISKYNQYGDGGWSTGLIASTGGISMSADSDYNSAVEGIGFSYDVTVDASLSAELSFGAAGAAERENLYFSVFRIRDNVHEKVYPAETAYKTYACDGTVKETKESISAIRVQPGDTLYFLFSVQSLSESTGGDYNYWVRNFHADIYAKPITVLSTMNSASENWPTQANKGAVGGGWGFYNYIGTTLTPITYFQDATSWWVSGNVSTAGGTGGLFNSSNFEWYPNATQVASCGENQTGGFGFGYGVASAKELIIDLSFTKSASLTEGITGWFTIVKYSPNGTAMLVQQKTLTGNATAETITLKDVKVSAAAGDKLLFLFAHNNTAKRTAVATEFDATIYTTTEEKQPEGTLISSLEKGNDNWPSASNSTGSWVSSRGFSGGWDFMRKTNASAIELLEGAFNTAGFYGRGSWNMGAFGVGNNDGKVAMQGDGALHSNNKGVGFAYQVTADAVYSIDTGFEVLGAWGTGETANTSIYFSIYRIRGGVHTRVYPAAGNDMKYVSSTTAYAMRELATNILVENGDTIYFVFSADVASTNWDFKSTLIQNFSADIYAQPTSELSAMYSGHENWPVRNADGTNAIVGPNWDFYSLNGTTLTSRTERDFQNGGDWWVYGNVAGQGGLGGLMNGSAFEWTPSAAQLANCGENVAGGFGFGYTAEADDELIVDVSFNKLMTKQSDKAAVTGWFTLVQYQAAGGTKIIRQEALSGTGLVSLDGLTASVKAGDKLLFLFAVEAAAAGNRINVANTFHAVIDRVADKVESYGSSVNVNADLTLNMFWNALLATGETTGMEYSEDKTFATGVTEVAGVLDQNTNLYSCAYAGLAAKELNKVIYGRPYATDGVTKEYGDVTEFSLAGYFADVAAGSFTAEEKELVASVETYCKAADNYFNGAANVLGDLADFTTDKNAAAHASEDLSNTLENVQFKDVSLKLEEQVQFTLYFAGKAGVTNGYKLQVATDVAFTNVVGNFDFVTMSDDINSLVVADVLGGPLDYNTAYFFRVVNADGTAVVSHILEYSVAAYCDRMNNTSNDAHNALCNAIMAVYAKATNE